MYIKVIYNSKSNWTRIVLYFLSYKSIFKTCFMPNKACFFRVFKIYKYACACIFKRLQFSRQVDNVYDVMCLVQHGLRTRRESATLVHEHSSRSHLVVTLTLTSEAPSFFSKDTSHDGKWEINMQWALNYPDTLIPEQTVWIKESLSIYIILIGSQTCIQLSE